MQYRAKESSIRHKMNIIASSIANYTRLIESLSHTQKTVIIDNDFESEEKEDGDFDRRGSGAYEKKLSSKIFEFEQKLKTFIK